MAEVPKASTRIIVVLPADLQAPQTDDSMADKSMDSARCWNPYAPKRKNSHLFARVRGDSLEVYGLIAGLH